MSAIGLRVGPFEIIQEAAVPEPGSWYLGRRVGMTRRQPRDVLVQLLPPDATSGDRAVLQRQFEVLRALDDPRVPAPVAFYEGTGALAVTAVDGAPLSRLVAARSDGDLDMTPATLLDLALELAESLLHAHNKGRAHGHLSPDTVLLGADGHVWVWGYGPGPIGAPPEPWCAPERARGEPITVATDQWSLGALVAALVTGRPPWRGDAPLTEARRGDPEPAIGPIASQWPALGRLVRRLLDPHPGNRFPSMNPVRQELLALSRKAGGVSSRRELGSALSRPRAAVPPPAPEVDAPTVRSPSPAFVAEALAESERPPAATPEPLEQAPRGPTADEPPPTATVRPTTDAPPRPATPLPSEPMPVVRLDVGEPSVDTGLDEPERTGLGERAPTEFALDRALTEMVADRAPTESVGDRAPTEMVADRMPTEMAPERIPTEFAPDRAPTAFAPDRAPTAFSDEAAGASVYDDLDLDDDDLVAPRFPLAPPPAPADADDDRPTLRFDLGDIPTPGDDAPTERLSLDDDDLARIAGDAPAVVEVELTDDPDEAPTDPLADADDGPRPPSGAGDGPRYAPSPLPVADDGPRPAPHGFARRRGIPSVDLGLDVGTSATAVPVTADDDALDDDDEMFPVPRPTPPSFDGPAAHDAPSELPPPQEATVLRWAPWAIVAMIAVMALTLLSRMLG